jgi:pyroglutamyl-peptidase
MSSVSLRSPQSLISASQSPSPSPRSLLLTSFDTWLPHHSFNSSDVLLEKILQQGQLSPAAYHLFRRLPVQTDQAFSKIKTAIQIHQPHIVICCGMAESRRALTLEWQAHRDGHLLHTSLNLSALAQGLVPVRLSQDAGNFVCNAVYYQVLNLLLHPVYQPTVALFVHVPPLPPTQALWDAEALSILGSFQAILSRLILQSHPNHSLG